MGIKWNIINAIGAPPIMRVGFQFGNTVITPVAFIIVAQLIDKGRINTAVDSQMPAGAEAIYNPSTDTIVAPFDTYGRELWDEKSVLIHESVHAYLDAAGGRITNGQSMTCLDDETIAYLAGAMYLVAANVYTSSGKIGTIAIKTVKSKMAAAPTPKTLSETIAFSKQEVKDLQTAISTDPTYSADANSHAQHDGLKKGLEGLWVKSE
jgi:hypothetical protein